MNAEILCVGTELLLGDIVNTNAQFIAKELAALGISVYFQTVVGDNEARLLEAYRIAFGRADIVIVSGGLGPTEDDLTKETAAKYFNKEMVLDEASWKNIQSYFAAQKFKMTDNNKKQAIFPVGSVIIANEKGTAPGCMIEQDGKTLIMMPGPPGELLPMFTKEVVPLLKEKTGIKLFSRTLRICGVGESSVENMLKDLIHAQSNPTIAPYAKTSEVHMRVTAAAGTEEEGRSLMAPIIDEMYRRLGENIYGENEVTLEEAVVKEILACGMTIACAESCTGGMLTARLVDYPGVSEVLREGIVSYSNEAKLNRLGVKPETLSAYGAVSAETAAEMAAGAAERSGSDIGVSTTGIAGPSGGTDDKPVGLVYIGIYINGKTTVREFRFRGDREKIRSRTVVNALDFLRRELYGIKENIDSSR